MKKENGHIIFAKASFFVIQVGRLCNIYGLDELFDVLDAKCQELADLMEVIDVFDDPGSFKINNKNEIKGVSNMGGMNEGGEAQNIIYIKS